MPWGRVLIGTGITLGLPEEIARRQVSGGKHLETYGFLRLFKAGIINHVNLWLIPAGSLFPYIFPLLPARGRFVRRRVFHLYNGYIIAQPHYFGNLLYIPYCRIQTGILDGSIYSNWMLILPVNNYIIFLLDDHQHQIGGS